LLQTNNIYIKVEASKVLHLEPAWHGDKIGTLRIVDQKYLESFKCSAGEGWRRSFGQIVREMKKYYIVSMMT